ncbi:MAG: hypothetical protein RBR86_01680 [Pseudobdellovibrionaceae bacterium]|jgi:hypothetical protein|nr:hypothetical protein [Pseudobdellovibrionaceae bacterium]
MPEDFIQYIGLSSALLGSSTLIIYIYTMIKGQSRPHIFTWLIWSILSAIGFAAQLSQNAGSGSWTLGLVAALCAAITLLSLKYGSKDFSRRDMIALACALGALIPWIILKDPILSVVLISIINAIGFYPTFRKSWRQPHQEHLIPYSLSSLAMTLSLFALNEITISTSLYTITAALSNMLFVVYSLWRRKMTIHA